MIVLILVIVGLALGSFAGAQVWRLRARQLVFDQANGEKVDAKEMKRLKPLSNASVKTDRSQCLSCGHTLRWYDLIPVVSWVSTGGRCRYCKKFIGWFEPLMEIGLATFFVVSYLLWPVPLEGVIAIVLFLLWLLAGVGLAILCGYDAKWSLLPNVIMFPLIAVAVIFAGLRIVISTDPLAATLDTLGAIGILAGLYLLLWIGSKGRWIGFGDVKLGLVLGLLLGEWKLALLALFAANLIGTLIVVPGMMSGKISRSTRVPFGPLLILGFVIAAWWGSALMEWYFTALFI